MYRPPNCKDDWFIHFEKNLLSANKYNKEIILLGDLNVDMLFNSSKQSKLSDITNSFQLMQLIDTPTRITESSETLIDHIYVSNLSKAVSSKVRPLPLSLSGHFAVLLTYRNKCLKEAQSSHKVITFRP